MPSSWAIRTIAMPIAAPRWRSRCSVRNLTTPLRGGRRAPKHGYRVYRSPSGAEVPPARDGEGGGMPADEPQPALAEHGDLAQAIAAETAKAEVVVLPHQLVPPWLLVGLHGPNPLLA